METCKPMTADDFYQQGNDYRRKGDWQHAIDCYLEAINLDPLSPAVAAKQMLDRILGLYGRDMDNPERVGAGFIKEKITQHNHCSHLQNSVLRLQ